MENYLRHIPQGESIPFCNPHAVSVSFPKLQDVIGYEEGNPEVKSKMKSGYPRFFRNKFVDMLVEFIRLDHEISLEKVVVPITSLKAKVILEMMTRRIFDFIELDGNVFLILDRKETKLQEYLDLIRNAGLIISSRKAEETLFKNLLLDTVFNEEKLNYNQAKCNILNTLSEAYGTSVLDGIYLTNSGVNALFAANEAVLKLQQGKGKTRVVQLGWLYVDSVEIISKRSKNPHIQVNVHDLSQLENWLAENHQSVAVVVTESVTNPLLHCVDLPRLYALCEQFDVKLIVDNTLGTAYGVEALPYCDILVESLTKFACGKGDVLMGAVIVKDQVASCKEEIQKYIIPPFEGEVKRLGFEILDYESRVTLISQNTIQLEAYLREKSEIKEVFSVLHPNSVDSFMKVQKDGLVPGLISITFRKDLAHYYDKIRLAKGPSLGTEFTLAMPYVYLAHYDYLVTNEGVEKLKNLGLDKNLLRISVGTEPIEQIIDVFEEVLEDVICVK